ncbi:MAG: hypothetical protein QW517_06995, partial [Thermofilaceae archaeon]
MGISQWEAELVLEAKRAYWSKVLSEEAIDINFWRGFDVYDIALTSGDWTMSDTLWSSLVLSVLYDIPVSDIVPWQLSWEVKPPTEEEF